MQTFLPSFLQLVNLTIIHSLINVLTISYTACFISIQDDIDKFIPYVNELKFASCVINSYDVFMSNQHCPLCASTATLFIQDDSFIYFICDTCSGIFLKHDQILSAEDEKARYDTHNNDVEDPRYQNFVSPITASVIKKHPKSHIGLDFGCGPGPVITHVLKHHGYQLNLYDPIYQPNQAALDQTYDYIVCCEVMEHFSDPKLEFSKLHGLLKPKGSLYCMTWLYDESKDFKSWFYRKDPTHVFFYQKETIAFIADQFKFKSYQINDRLITFQR